VERKVDSARGKNLLSVDAFGLAGEEPRPVDAVAAEIHQRAAIKLGAQADVPLVAKQEAERRPNQRKAPDRAAGDEVRDFLVCGWWRYMKPS
jgi:hypothetical protein